MQTPNTISELSTFVIRGSSYEAAQGNMMTLVINTIVHEEHSNIIKRLLHAIFVNNSGREKADLVDQDFEAPLGLS